MESNLKRIARNNGMKVSPNAVVYSTSIMTCLVNQVLHPAVVIANQSDSNRVTPRCLQRAIRNDDELDKLIKAVINGFQDEEYIKNLINGNFP